MDKIKIVGLFGTCGGSTWREAFEKKISELGAMPYNPVQPDWTPEMLKIEANHLANDDAIVIVITNETTSFISLAEVGMTLLSVKSSNRKAIVYVEEVTALPKNFEFKLWEESMKVRKAVIAHLSKVDGDGWLYVANSLEDALDKLEYVI